MSTQFELRLLDAAAPEGELDADHLLALVHSLKEVATRIGRAELRAEPVGRPPARVQSVSRLVIGLTSGSTRVQFRRASPAEGAFEFDLDEERAFDTRFDELLEAVALDQRPEWVDDSLARATEELTTALRQATTRAEYVAGGQLRHAFTTSQLRRGTWQTRPGAAEDSVVFVGRLYAVNLKTHRLQVQDDVGHQVALPDTPDDVEASRLLGSAVVVTGRREVDSLGRLTHIHEAVIAPAPEPVNGSPMEPSVSLEAILHSATGVEPGGIEGVTDAEYDSFLEAMGL